MCFNFARIHRQPVFPFLSKRTLIQTGFKFNHVVAGLTFLILIRFEMLVWNKLGKNKIGEILTKARAILDTNQSAGKISNRSVRKPTVTRLLDNDVDPIFVSQLTGHKRLESLNSYYRASKVQQQQISNIPSMGAR